MTGTTKRSYHSPLRQRRAAESRQRVIDCAAKLFNDRGYNGTTMSAIASAAKLSIESVHGVGQKGELLLFAIRRAYDERLLDSGWIDELLEMDFNEAVELWVDVHVQANKRTAGLWMSCRAAASAEPTVGSTLDELVAQRRAVCTGAVRWLVKNDVISSGISNGRLDEMASSIAVLFSPETYCQLVQDWNLDEASYRESLIRGIHRLGIGEL